MIRKQQNISPENLGRRLRRNVRGRVLTDATSRGLYATDASIYQMMPLAVVQPLDRADAVAAVRTAITEGAAILPRGGGTSLAGQTIGHAVVLDLTPNMNRVLEVNPEQRWARVEPGVVLDELNARLEPEGLFFAPDPASGNRAAIGGMIATNAAGMRSIRYGMTIDHVLELDVILASGEVLTFGPLDEGAYARKCQKKDREGELYRRFRKLIQANRRVIRERYPKVRRRSGGYPLDAFADPLPWNMARLFAGAEGTLGLVLEARLNLEPRPTARGLCLAHFTELPEALRAVEPIVRYGPSCVELLDGRILTTARQHSMTRDCGDLIDGRPGAMLVIEADGTSSDQVRERLQAIAAGLREHNLGYACPTILDPDRQARVWLMRKNGIGLMEEPQGERMPTPVIEDAAVPLDRLPEYVEKVITTCRAHGQEVSVYGHAGVGLVHARPLLDLHRAGDVRTMRRIADEVFEVVRTLGGAWSGEHGDGIVRGAYNERFFGKTLYRAFHELKRMFDPPGLMNPGKIVNAPPMTENLRYGPGYRMQVIPTMFHYRAEGGFRQAVEACTGVGVCRKTLEDTMCPSYIATRDEEHSTRGRANALRLAMTGQLGSDALTRTRLQQVFDLCLSCKACKNECPNAVDMTRLKAEVLHQYHLRHGMSWRERIIRDLPLSAHLASGMLAPAANLTLSLAVVRWALDRFLGIDRRRKLPGYARRRLTAWFEDRPPRQPTDTPHSPPKVALFNDTYMQHYEPSVGQAAVEVLEAAGYQVELVTAGCCQRPALSKGFLDVAKRRGTRTMENLDDVARRGLPIVVCEPSCAAALTDDLPDLIDDADLGRRVAAAVLPIDLFLERELAAGRCRLPLRTPETERPPLYLVHGHCHQKALHGNEAMVALLRRIPGARVKQIDSGCCGMAGSFGYEKEHYDLSMKVGEDRLFPALRSSEPGTCVVACGFSCRHQIRDGVNLEARHVIEYLREAMAQPTDSPR